MATVKVSHSVTTVLCDDSTPYAIRQRIEAEALMQPRETRWRLRNIVGGVRVFDDALGTVTDYIINEDWGV